MDRSEKGFIQYEVWEMMRLTEKLRTRGHFFFVELTDGKVTGYQQRRKDGSNIWLGDQIAMSTVSFKGEGHTPEEIDWVDQNRDRFRVLGRREHGRRR